jgi:hypothetical protein
MSPADLAQRIAALDWSATSLQHQLAISAAILTLSQGNASMPAPAPSNVIALPVRQRTCWTTLHHLDGREWATSSHFGPGGAWAWIVESVAHEHSVSDDQIGCAESGDDQPYDGDDLVTIDGLPVYRIRHLCK